MATPELATGSLGRSRQREIPAAGSLSPVGSGQVVEFDRRRSPVKVLDQSVSVTHGCLLFVAATGRKSYCTYGR